MADTPAAHVFVVQGDLTRLACDAWLLPTDQTVSVTPGWHEKLPQLAGHLERTDLSALRNGTRLAVALDAGDAATDAPLIIATAVPLFGFDEPAELLPALRQFVETAASTTGTPRNGRPKRLFAFPFFGTAGGGGATRRGAIFDALHAEARSLAREYDLDLAFVFATEASFALAQRRRQRASDVASGLPEHLQDALPRLARLARDGRLVPFLGAGVSVSAGAPSWGELITQLGLIAGLNDAESTSLAGSSHSPLDQAAYLRMLFDQRHGDDSGEHFQRAIAAIVDRRRYGLAPALLASLESEQAITLNYDELFELACADAGKPRRVIPGDEIGSERWLLKLHGSVTDPSTIVLTRDDYLGFNSERAALSALVKATLMTRHLLFVGFGLRDDHFHEIVHDVRRAVGGSAETPAATALTLRHDPLHDALWSGQLKTVPMDLTRETTITEAGRLLEIFLDVLICASTDSHSYLLHPDFVEALTPEEQALRAALEHIRFVIEIGQNSTAEARVKKLLASFGGTHN